MSEKSFKEKLKNHYEVAREELSFYEKDGTSLQNLIAVLIGPKADPTITGELASLGIERLVTMSAEELKEFNGIGELTARRIVSSFGLASKINKHKKDSSYIIRSPEDAANCFSDLEISNQEHFEVLYLTTKNKVISRKEIFRGSLNASIVHPREIFREAVRLSSAGIIVCHNHPSGDPTPSREDISVTKRLVESGKMIGIEILDHIIIGSKKFVSLKQKGYI